MPSAGQFGQVADRLGSLGGLAERHFTATGDSLTQAVGILAALTTTFQALLAELRGSELSQSGQDLAFAAASVGTLADTARADVATLRQVAGEAEAITIRIGQMHSVLQEVHILAMNARLVAATMGEAGVGFLPFAAEIRRSARAARDGLDRLATELADARLDLQAAGAAAGEFAALHTGSMQAITVRLAASVASIDAHVTQSGDAAAIAGSRAEEIHNQVAAAIVSLQLGDITRQRIEHMQSACRLLAKAGRPPPLASRLVAAQLLDVAEELEHGAAGIVAELQILAADASDIARQGNLAYGATDHRSGSFLDELEADRAQAQALFGHVSVARDAVSPRIAAVRQAAGRLVGHIAMIRSVEADIHIMGINTSLKCGRLGVMGRPLSVIAQAVRSCGRQTAQHAGAVLEALERVLAGATALAAAVAAADDIDASAQRMTRAVRLLGDTGERMRQALTRLASEGEAVAQLMRQAIESFAGQREIGAVLRDAAAACSQAGGDSDADDGSGPVLAQIAAGYTMARERAVHARFVPAAIEPTAEAVIEDVLF